jgi:hypothetical protein
MSDPAEVEKVCQSMRVDSSRKSAQDWAAQSGFIDAAVSILGRFPEEKAVQIACIEALGQMTLFNYKNGLRAGRLGGLNYTLKAYKNWMDDPRVTSLGGNIGCFFDYVPENRAIARELKGIELLIQDIRNNFHGQYSEWGEDPVRNSLFGLSSGCWSNQDICYKEGLLELDVELMNEHGEVVKIAEEALQATRAMMDVSNEYRDAFADAGGIEAVAHVMDVNPHDRGALSLACINVRMLINGRSTSLNQTIQSRATQAGLLHKVTKILMGGEEIQHQGHSSFNFDVDASYNVDRDCLSAAEALVTHNPASREALRKAGLVEHAAGLTSASSSSCLQCRTDSKVAACSFLSAMSTSAETTLKGLKAAGAC